jgi:hypothetical protein
MYNNYNNKFYYIIVIEVANYARSTQFKLRTSRPFFLVPLTFNVDRSFSKLMGFSLLFFLEVSRRKKSLEDQLIID